MRIVHLQDIRQIYGSFVPVYWTYKEEMISPFKASTRTGRTVDNIFYYKDESLTSCIPCVFSCVVSVLFLCLHESTLVGASYACLADI